MLKKILSISGKPGLYKLVSYGKTILVVERLSDGKRFPAHSRDKIISLGDISIYTDSEEMPLGEVFETIYKKYEGKPIEMDKFKSGADLVEFFADVLPEYDRDRVYNNDIKKVIAWYNALIDAGFTSFKREEEPEEKTEEK